MKLIIVTNGDGPEMRDALALSDKIAAEGLEVEKFEWESEEASVLAGMYDLYSTPAFIVTGDDGREIEKWQGETQPVASEIKHLMM